MQDLIKPRLPTSKSIESVWTALGYCHFDLQIATQKPIQLHCYSGIAGSAAVMTCIVQESRLVPFCLHMRQDASHEETCHLG